MLPAENAPEAAIVEGIDVYGMSSLPEVIGFFRGDQSFSPVSVDRTEAMACGARYEEDFSDVKGQEQAKRAL
ncbi:MAG: hypothetical protein GWN86_28680, partial [Desulfobacterales bacterium]|nr:hypothetical protein [Desulfobacterales bacterium]